ncbi:MAG: anti-sigma factor family protein [Solirubrobacterales bacterium]
MSVGTERELACRELVELVTDYLEGALSEADVRRFEAHIAACDACTRYLEQMRATISSLGHLPPESLSPEAEAELLAAFRGWSAER